MTSSSAASLASPDVTASRWLPGVGRHPSDLTVAILVLVACVVPVFLVGTLAVEIDRSLHLGAAGLGSAVAIFYLGTAVFGVPLGRLTDSVGAARIMRAAALTSAVLLVLVATAARSWAVLVVVLFFAGAAEAAANSATNRFLARRIPLDRQGRGFGIKQAAVPLSTLIAGLAVPTVAVIGGWRWAFGVGAVFALVVATLVSVPSVRRDRSRAARRAAPRAKVRLLPLAFLATGQGLGIFAASGLAAFLVTAGVESGFSQSAAGLTAGLGGGLAAAVRIVMGRLADRRGGGHFGTVAAMLAAGTFGYVALAASSATSTRWLFIVGAAVAFGIGWGWSGLMNFAITASHPHAPANASGVIQVGMGIGGIAGPFTLGLIIEHHSYTLIWVAAGCASLLAACAVLVGSRLLRRSAEDTVTA